MNDDQYGGSYRAQFLSVDLLGNVTCTVPSITGDAPLVAMSAGFNYPSKLTPGSLGWVVFEGGDPSLPVWVGFAGGQGDWNLAWGVVSPVVYTTPTFSGAGPWDLASVAWTPRPDRLYCLRGHGHAQNLFGSPASVVLLFTDSGNNSITAAADQVAVTVSSGGNIYLDVSTRPLTFGSVPRTDKLRVTGTNVGSTSSSSQWIWVEDVGPAVASAIAVGPPVLTAPSNTAFGIIDWKNGVHVGATTPAFTNSFASVLKVYEFVNLTMLPGRRYEIRFSSRADNPGTYFSLFKDGVFNRDVYGTRDTAAFGSINYVWELNGSDHPGTHTWTIGAASTVASTGTIYTDNDSASVKDIGSSSGPIMTVPAPVNVVPGGWQTPTFVNSWVNYGAGWAPARYRLNNDRVEIEGLVKSGTPDSTVFTLPLGFRPVAGNVLFAAAGQQSVQGLMRIDVQPDGQVIIRNITTGTGAANYAQLNCSFGIT